MLIVLYAFWLLLEGQWNLEIALTGLVLCAALYLFAWRVLRWSPKREWRYIRRLPGFFSYLFFLVRQIFASGMATIHYIWSPKEIVQPELVSFSSGLHTEMGKVVLANSITMTPGTITVDVREDRLLVHCLDETMAEGIESSEMCRRVLALEGGEKQ